MSQFSDDGNVWYASFEFTSMSSKTITIPLTNGSQTFITRGINLMFPFKKASVSNNSGYKQITSAGWVGFSTGSTSGTMSKSGNDYIYNVNDNQVKVYEITSTHYWGRVVFQTKNTIVPANTRIVATVNPTRCKSYAMSSPGYVPIGYAFQTSTSGNGNDISSIVRDGSTWSVLDSNGNYIKAVASGINVNITAGSNFRYEVYEDYHSGYWQTTPGGRRWISGYTNYYYRVYVNGTKYETSSSSISFYAYCPNSSNGDVVYLSK